jgi:hypothetical protein
VRTISGRTSTTRRPEVQHFPPRPRRDPRAPDSSHHFDIDYFALECRLLSGVLRGDR